MSSGVAVPDSSPLIIFWQTGRLELLSALFREFAVPTAVRREVSPSLGVLPTWTQEFPAPMPPLVAQLVDDGEREAIALALAAAADLVVLDDLRARRVALSLGLDVMGSTGLLLRVRNLGLIQSIKTDLDAMASAGLYLSVRRYEQVLASAEELG